MVKKQETSKGEHCVNPKVFEEYIGAARLVILQARSAFVQCSTLSQKSAVHIYFVSLCSENDLEDVLTFYTQKNKSATVFLGAKVRGVKKDVREGNVSGNCENSKCEFLACFFFMCIFHTHTDTHTFFTVGLVYVSIFYHSSIVNRNCLDL